MHGQYTAARPRLPNTTLQQPLSAFAPLTPVILRKRYSIFMRLL
jgi:hypothetical protein